MLALSLAVYCMFFREGHEVKKVRNIQLLPESQTPNGPASVAPGKFRTAAQAVAVPKAARDALEVEAFLAKHHIEFAREELQAFGVLEMTDISDMDAGDIEAMCKHSHWSPAESAEFSRSLLELQQAPQVLEL